MHYFIDGYNLLFRLRQSSDRFQTQRESIIRDLNKKISLVKLDVSIVFDSTFQIGERSRAHVGAVEVLFTAEGETADEYILDELKHIRNPNQETIVTSDKRLASKVRHRLARTETVENFMLRLNRSYKKKLDQLKSVPSPPASPPLVSTPPPSIPSSLIPPKNAPLEAYTEYYARIFEAEWQKIIQQEENRKKAVSNKRKRLPRRPRRSQDVFQMPSPPEPPAETEMERWLRAFEKRLSDPDLFSKYQ